MKHLTIQQSNINKVFKVVLAVFLMAGLFLANTAIATAAPAAAPTTFRPFGNTYTTTPTYSWSKQGTTTQYRLQVLDVDANTIRIDAVVNNLSCDSSTNRCAFMSATTLINKKTYSWRVAAGKGAFSAWKPFVVLPGFSSDFRNNAAGWISRPGGDWTTLGGNGTIHTNGQANKWSSISHSGNFNNFTYIAKMKRVSATGGSSGFWVRGRAPTFDPTYNGAKNAYFFLYSQNGCFSVWKHVNGAIVAKKGWTLSSSIAKNDWNTLKVIADGNQLRFYINNKLVWNGSDASFKTGQVALTMFTTSTTERLDVDWAKLGMSSLFQVTAFGAAYETVEQGQVEIAPDPSHLYGPEQAPVIP